MSAFVDLFATWPRQGPGDRASLDFAPRILGLGRDAVKLDDAAWEVYYGPMKDRIFELAPTAKGVFADTLRLCQAEIDSWRKVRQQTGNVQILASVQ